MIKLDTCDFCGAAAPVTVNVVGTGGELPEGKVVPMKYCMHDGQAFAEAFGAAEYTGSVLWQGSIFPVGPAFFREFAQVGLTAVEALTQSEWVPVTVPAFGLDCDACKVKLAGGDICYQNGLETRCWNCCRAVTPA